MTPEKEYSRARQILGMDPGELADAMWLRLLDCGPADHAKPPIHYAQKLRGGHAFLNPSEITVGTSLPSKSRVASTLLHELCHMHTWTGERSPRDTGHCRKFNAVLVRAADALWGLDVRHRYGFRMTGFAPTDAIEAALARRGSVLPADPAVLGYWADLHFAVRRTRLSWWHGVGNRVQAVVMGDYLEPFAGVR